MEERYALEARLNTPHWKYDINKVLSKKCTSLTLDKIYYYQNIKDAEQLSVDKIIFDYQQLIVDREQSNNSTIVVRNIETRQFYDVNQILFTVSIEVQEYERK